MRLYAAVLALAAAAPAQDAGALYDIARGFTKQSRTLVRPSDAELAADRLPWLPSFAAGLKAARASKQPLLLWAMNGHPLGCT